MSNKAITVPNPIPQSLLSQLNKLRNTVEMYEESLEEARSRAVALETAIMLAIDEGAKVAPGKLVALIETVKGACRPPWKDIFKKHWEIVHAGSQFTWAMVENTSKEEHPATDRRKLVVGLGGGK